MTQCIPFTCNKFVPNNGYGQTHERTIILPYQKDTLIDVNILVTYRNNIRSEYTPKLGFKEINLTNLDQTIFLQPSFEKAEWISENQLIIPIDLSFFGSSIDMRKHQNQLCLTIVCHDNYFVETTGLIYTYGR